MMILLNLPNLCFKNLYKSDAEIIEEFEKKRKENEAPKESEEKESEEKVEQ